MTETALMQAFEESINDNLMDEVIENMDYMVRVMDQENNIVYMNKKMREEFGDLTCHKCFDIIGASEKCLDCVSSTCHKTGKAESKDIQYGERFFRVIASPARTKDDKNYAIELFHDITVQKVLQEEILNQYDKMKTDLEFAKQIQNRVLPINDTYWDLVRFDSAYAPSEDLSGDMFDLIRIDDNNILFYMADVSGHGIKSSLLTMFLRQAIRGNKKDALDPWKLLTEIIKSYTELKLGDEYYMSIVFCLLDAESKTLTFINAGHNSLPIYIGKSGEPEEIKIFGMPVCNLLKEANHDIKMIRVSSGDKVILHTDGIAEAYNDATGEYFSDQKLMEIIRENRDEPGDVLVQKVIGAVGGFVKGPLADDAAILAVEIL